MEEVERENLRVSIFSSSKFAMTRMILKYAHDGDLRRGCLDNSLLPSLRIDDICDSLSDIVDICGLGVL
jgi:hypothetical protein